MSSEEQRFTKESFLDYDQRRTTFGSQGVGTTAGQRRRPLPGTERVLKISIPYDPVWRRTQGSYKLDLTHPEEDPQQTQQTQREHGDIEIDPCGYVNSEYLEADEYLLERLCALPPALNGPQITGSGRQLIDIDAPLYARLFEEAETAGEYPAPRPDPERLSGMTSLLDAHERDPQIEGSHADIMLNPQTRTVENTKHIPMLIHLTSGSASDFDSQFAPTRSAIYHELSAMTAERRTHAGSAALEVDPDREKLDSYREKSETYSLALEILRWLRGEHWLSYEEITSLLDMCRYSRIPMTALCFGLADLADGMAVEDIPYNSSAFDLFDTDVDAYYSTLDTNFERLNSSLAERLFETTFETVSLEEGKVIKEWWTRNPPAVFPLPVIRILIHLRDLTEWSRRMHNQPLIVTTAPQQSVSGVDRSNLTHNGKVIAGFRYQDPRESTSAHPLWTAMSESVSPEKMGKLTAPKTDAAEKVQSYVRTIRREVLRQRYESDFEGFNDWLTGAAPTESSLGEVVRWFV